MAVQAVQDAGLPSARHIQRGIDAWKKGAERFLGLFARDESARRFQLCCGPFLANSSAGASRPARSNAARADIQRRLICSWTWMTQAVIAEISAIPRIIRLEPLHAVGHRVPWRRTNVAGRGVIRA